MTSRKDRLKMLFRPFICKIFHTNKLGWNLVRILRI